MLIEKAMNKISLFNNDPALHTLVLQISKFHFF